MLTDFRTIMKRLNIYLGLTLYVSLSLTSIRAEELRDFLRHDIPVTQKSAAPVAHSSASSPAAPLPLAPLPAEWFFGLTPHLSVTTYQQSLSRQSVTSFGLAGDAQYLERWGIAMGLNQSTVKMQQNAPDLLQNALYLSGRMMLTPDFFPGKVTLRADAHLLNNNDATNETNAVRVFAPQVSFLNFAHDLYGDLGYAYSQYGDSNTGKGSLNVNQLTATFGMAFNAGADWIQSRLYNIQISNPLRAQNETASTALETQWMHYLAPVQSASWLPAQWQLGLRLGKRIYAVDHDSASVYNFADIQREGLTVGFQWPIKPDAKFLFGGGYDRFETPDTNAVLQPYSALYLYSGLHSQW